MQERTHHLDRRTLLKSAAGTSTAAALAGCSGLFNQSGTGSGGQSQGNPASKDVPDSPINAGMLTFTKGAPAVSGIHAQRGAELAIKRINDSGGIANKRKIQLEVVDETSGVVNSYRGFVKDEKDVTFGPISSSNHQKMAPVIENAGIINVATAGTVTSLFEKGGADPNPTYDFRFQNYDVMECIACARAVVNKLGADNIDTVAGINPDYSFGHDEMDMFGKAMKKLAGAEVIYTGWPELGASDMSPQITSVKQKEPDVTYASFWGGDVITLFKQAAANSMFEHTQLIGPLFYTVPGHFTKNLVEQSNALSGSRNYYWGYPSPSRWPPAQKFIKDASSQDGVTVPTNGYMAGYGAVAAWATATEKAVQIHGGWPSQKQIADVLESHGFFHPGGFSIMTENHQARTTAYVGELTYSSKYDAAALKNVQEFSPNTISPPVDEKASSWLDGWGA